MVGRDVPRSFGATLDTLERLKTLLGDRYLVERELGRGGMATVYLARDLKHDREVAVKVLHPELSASIGSDRFEREIKLAARLQHPNILGLYDSGAVEGLLYYVMPFIKGESLRDRLERDGPLPIEEAIQYVLEVADALAFAHATGIVHRDIKPENVLISNGHALVADFGIARAAQEGGGEKLTQTGMALGTPAYMSPEQAAGEAVGPPADIYSLGCMLYELLAGEPPFTGKNPMALMARHAMEAVPSIRIVRSTVPEEVEDTIFASMAKVPADRLQTAAAFAEMLGSPLGATASRRASIRQTASRRVPTEALRARTQAIEAPAPWWKRPAAIVAAIAIIAGGATGTWWLTRGPSGKPVVAGGLDPHSVAVLYFADATPDGRLAEVADGLTEALMANLGQIQSLRVISRGGVDQFRKTSLPLDSIARSLSAGTLVTGTVEPTGDKIRVTVKLVDGNSGGDFDRAGFELPAANLIAVRDTLAAQATGLIRKVLGEEIKRRNEREGTSNAQAWSLLQRAERLRKSGDTLARTDTAAMGRAFAEADSLLAIAESLDPKWPDPVVLRGQIAYRRSRLGGLDPYAARDRIALGAGHVERAIKLEPNNADALELRGNLRYWKWLLGIEANPDSAKALLQAAKNDFEAATAVNPGQGGAWASLSHLQAQIGTSADVKLAAQSALRADAFLANADVVLNRLFLANYDLNNTTEAEQNCAEIRRRFPASFNAPRCELYLLGTRARTADPARAWALADTALSRAPASRTEFERLKNQMLVAAVLVRANLADSARRVIERSKGSAEIDAARDLMLFGAFVYAQLGDKDKAIDYIRDYLAANERRRAGFLDDPGWWFASIANDPRLIQLVRGAS